MPRKTYIVQDLNQLLFWDVDESKLEWKKNDSFLVQRVLEFGTAKDWEILKEVYGVKKIAEVATTLRVLDEVALHFISTLSGIPLDKFRCYKPTPSPPNYYGY